MCKQSMKVSNRSLLPTTEVEKLANKDVRRFSHPLVTPLSIIPSILDQSQKKSDTAPFGFKLSL